MTYLATRETKQQRADRLSAIRQANLVAPDMPSLDSRRAAEEGLAACEAATVEYLSLTAALSAIQADMDSAADQQVSACGPIQAELPTLGTDDRSGKRRLELLNELASLNLALENRLRELKSQALAIEQRKNHAGMRAAQRPKHLAEIRCCRSSATVTAQRVKQRRHRTGSVAVAGCGGTTRRYGRLMSFGLRSWLRLKPLWNKPGSSLCRFLRPARGHFTKPGGRVVGFARRRSAPCCCPERGRPVGCLPDVRPTTSSPPAGYNPGKGGGRCSHRISDAVLVQVVGLVRRGGSAISTRP